MNYECSHTHGHADIRSDLQTDLHVAVQIDQIEVDKGKYLHRHTRCAGISIHQHVSVHVEGTSAGHRHEHVENMSLDSDIGVNLTSYKGRF